MQRLCILILTLTFLNQITGGISSSKKEPLTVEDFDKIVYEWTKPLSETLNALRLKYYKLIDPEKALIEAIKSLVSTLDPHSAFVCPQEFKQLQETTQGEFFGIGVVIDNTKRPEHEALTLVEVISEGPAEKAGLRAQDKIVEIEGASVRGMSVEEIVSKLKGPKGQKVHVKVQRTSCAELLPFDIIRDVVKDQNAACFYFKDHNIFYLALNMFTENSIAHMEKLLNKCQTTKAKGLILDLRNNTGGLLNAVVDIAALFLDKESLVVSTKNREGKVIEQYTTHRSPVATSAMPIFIIVNNFTASAAEILAGCLRAHSDKKIPSSSPKNANLNVFIIGSKTFGKGSVQEVIPTSNDCALKITTALYYLPDNSSIQGTGLTPDFVITPRFAPTKDMVWFNKFFGQESSLRNAINVEQNEEAEKKIAEKEAAKTPQERRKDLIGSDYLVLSTLRLITLLDMAKQYTPKIVSTRHDAINFLKKNYASDDSIVMEEIKI